MPKRTLINDVMEDNIPPQPYLVANIDVPLDQIIDIYSPLFYQSPESVGVAIRGDDGGFIGFISRSKILELANESNTRELLEIGGLPQKRPIYLACPKKKCSYKELVVFYDIDNPPVCPYDHVELKRDKNHV